MKGIPMPTFEAQSKHVTLISKYLVYRPFPDPEKDTIKQTRDQIVCM
jgi:hypothetical protein